MAHPWHHDAFQDRSETCLDKREKYAQALEEDGIVIPLCDIQTLVVLTGMTQGMSRSQGKIL